MESTQSIRPHREKYSSFWRWMGFSVVVGVVPIAASLILAALINKPTSLSEIIAHGELLLASIALVAEALRDLQYTNKGNTDGFKSFIQWGSIILLPLSKRSLLKILNSYF